jgi:hypothetical protein
MQDISRINEIAPYIVEEDLDDWLVPSLASFYSAKINALAYRAYGSSGGISPVARRAFMEHAKAEIRSGLNTFIFKSEHWREGRDLNTYILTCLNRLAERTRWDTESTKKINVPICPACRTFGKREFLVRESKAWYCQACNDEIFRLEEEIKTAKNKPEMIDARTLISREAKLRLYKTFARHSRSGFRCPDCSRFIPESSDGTFGISCPYIDCLFFGKSEKLERMAHPTGLAQQNTISLNSLISNSQNYNSKTTLQDFLEAPTINADVEMEIAENLERDLKILINVIDDQVDSVKRINSAGTMMQKLLMYEAYQNMLRKYPEDMVSYLVHRKQNADFPVQARVFQEYAELMQNALPYSIKRGNNVYDVVSLTDPNIQLFDGISEFNATVRQDLTIPNNTTETYTGGRKFKCYGSCFIGMLIDVIDSSTNTSIKDQVEHYSFVQIKMKAGVKYKTSVLVKHFRIIPHYEMGGLVYLQRIRKRIVDSVYYRLNGKKRVPEKSGVLTNE